MPRRWRVATAGLVALMVYGLAITFGVAHHQDRRKSVNGKRPAATAVIPPNSNSAATAKTGNSAGTGPAAWSLPGPSRYEGVAAVGYPHTTLGAVALGYSALAARYTTDP